MKESEGNVSTKRDRELRREVFAELKAVGIILEEGDNIFVNPKFRGMVDEYLEEKRLTKMPDGWKPDDVNASGTLLALVRWMGRLKAKGIEKELAEALKLLFLIMFNRPLVLSSKMRDRGSSTPPGSRRRA